MSSNNQSDNQEEDEDTPEEYKETQQPASKPKKKEETRQCNSRLEELAKPRRWNLLGTWQCHAYLFEPERMQAIKEKIQELFSMSPEETEIYFNSLRSKKRKRPDGRLLKGKLREERMAAKKEANMLLYKLIKKAIKYSYKNAPPLLVTPMLRNIADNILELLAEIHQVEVPKRSDNDKFSQFLISLADWSAMFVSNIYYEVEVAERSDIENLKILENIRSYSTVENNEKKPDASGDKKGMSKNINQDDNGQEYQTKFVEYIENPEEAEEFEEGERVERAEEAEGRERGEEEEEEG